MLTVHIRHQTINDGKVTAPITYERDGSEGKRFVAAPLSIPSIKALLPDNTAFKRGETEVKGDRRRILLEDGIPVPLAFDAITGEPVGKHGMVKVHTVYEIPWTGPIISGSSDALSQAQCAALDTLTRIHAANLLPRLVGTGAANAKLTGFEPGVAISDGVYKDSPVIRAMYGLAPFGDAQVLGTEDTTVE